VLTRVPLVSVNTDAVPGAVNGLLGRFAAANAVAFEGTALPRAHVTGTPVRPELSGLDRSSEARRAGRSALGLPPDRQTVTAMGGSLGALRINRAVASLAGSWEGYGDRTVYHVTGRRDYESFAGGGAGESAGEAREAREAREAGGAGREAGLCYRVVPFEERMPQLYSAADVCVSRAGAMSVAELLISGVPAILVPLPGAPRDHQTRNAEAVVALGAAVHLPDPECDGERLAKELETLLSDADRLRAMGEAARRHAHPDAAARIAELVDAHAR
jgi:UDP-N-acetylglucosamine:LPS N-acetylglucosamine transferase